MGHALAAETEGALIGQVRLTEAWVDAATALVPAWVLSPLSVLPEHQGNGIGSALVRAVLDLAADTTRPLVFLEGHPDFYPRFGFGRASALGFLSPSLRIPDSEFQVARLPGHEPWMIGTLIYPDTFWQYDSVGLR
ncbi:GNAT family N-acetyltransferase [Ruania alkalisoli]|uniref:GNAT family N-acetyltransferase n=1 Tax=Ruania alkalisoli TaxID=2779775 RepID=UPI003CCD8E08